MTATEAVLLVVSGIIGSAGMFTVVTAALAATKMFYKGENE